LIGIVNYGIGNIKAFSNIYNQLDIHHKIITEKKDFNDVEKIILPGVGSFDHAMTCLNESGLLETLNSLVLDKKKPVLGICVGMQMMAMSSEEGELKGLGWIEASVKKFNKEKLGDKNPLPHMGWNSVIQTPNNFLFKNIDPSARFYFLHSYYFKSQHKKNSIALAMYGDLFSCAISKNNIYGVQFHPEKSHQNGIQLLKNFSNL
jgi:imidazole glycerol-phosphate synthase subunit HisH